MTLDPEAVRYQRPSIRARVLRLIAQGPASERTIREQLGCDLHAVATCLKSLRDDGMIRRLGPICTRPRSRGSVYALATVPEAPILRLVNTS